MIETRYVCLNIYVEQKSVLVCRTSDIVWLFVMSDTIRNIKLFRYKIIVPLYVITETQPLCKYYNFLEKTILSRRGKVSRRRCYCGLLYNTLNDVNIMI